ncbi:MAG: hypothetical protein MUC97_12080 [Bernardetiaceae bacterium]|jgi:hypothetical protein|nr:hypothetical protein [Bernardetiaceae bacterium]
MLPFVRLGVVCLALWAMLGGAGCNNSGSTAQETDQDTAMQEKDPWANEPLPQLSSTVPALPLAQRLPALNDSVSLAWEAMLKSDQQKLANLQTLLAQLTKLPKHNKALADSVRTLHQRLSTNRLTVDNLGNAAFMDQYEKGMELVIQQASRLKTQTPGADGCATCTELLEEVNLLYSSDVTIISRYNGFAGELNKTLKNQQDSIKILGEKFTQIKPRPTFLAEPVQ